MSTPTHISFGDTKGHLQILKIHKNGESEVVFDDKNVITSGMGYTLLKAFSTYSTANIANFQIAYFQLGVSGHSSLQVSSRGNLSASLSLTGYGTPVFKLSTHNLSSGSPAASQIFGVIPPGYIQKLSPTKVMYTIFLDDNTCNNQTLSEVGLFSKNPNISSPDGSYLCAYRAFTSITKKSDFSLLLRWTIEF